MYFNTVIVIMTCYLQYEEHSVSGLGLN